MSIDEFVYRRPRGGRAMVTQEDPEDSPWFRLNIEAHAERWGVDHSASASRSSEVRVTGLEVGDGSHAQVVVRAGGDWVKVQSDRRPAEEAARWVAEAAGGSPLPPAIAIIGAGLGHAIEAIAEQSRTTGILVLEPEPDLVAWMFARRDWRALIRAGRLMVLSAPAWHGAGQAWRVVRPGADSVLRLVHPVLAHARPDASRAAVAVLRRATFDARANESARRRFAGRYAANTLTNVPVILREASVDALAGTRQGRTAVLAAAGPSLNRNLEELRPVRDRVVLIAVDTALRPTLEAGIEPDFVVAVDPGEANARHFHGLPPCPATALVAETSVAPVVFRSFEGRTYTFNIADHDPWPWLAACGIRIGRLRAWGSVVITAVDLAETLGADTVVFIGTDLAYTHGQTYCRRTTYEEDWAAAAGPDRTLEWVWRQEIAAHARSEAGLDGAPVATAPHLVAFRDWLREHSTRASAPRMINATGAGILFGGRIETAPAGSWGGWLPPSRTARTSCAIERQPPRAAPSHPFDSHLLEIHAHPPARRNPPGEIPAPGLTPFMQSPPRERILHTRALQEHGASDRQRWQDPANLDPAWQARAKRAAVLVPPGTCVLDLGAGAESLRRFLHASCRYVPADIVTRSPDTVVVDVNAAQFPEGRFDVVTMLGLLEYVHDVRRVLCWAASVAAMVVGSYCARTVASADDRLKRGWVNDHGLVELLDLCRDARWNVAWLERLDALPMFDQWLFALRRLGEPESPG